MPKIRTVIPINAKAGKSVIQVTNPKTGKPVRTRVPADAVPGQAIEIDLPEDPDEQVDRPEQRARTPEAPQSARSKNVAAEELGIPIKRDANNDDKSQPNRDVKELYLPEARAEQPVEHTVVYSSPEVVGQPVYVSQPVPVIAAQPIVYQQPVVYQQKPNVIIVKEENKGIKDEDCCTALLAACACAWLLTILTGR